MEFQGLIDWLNANPDWLLFSVGFIAFVESLALAGIIVPGVAMLFVVAVAAGTAGVPIVSVLIAGFVGAILGDGVSYYLGYIFRDKLNRVWPFSRFPKAIETGARFFEKHGGKSVVIGRFVGPVRPVIPIVAGMFGMSQLRFLSFNVLSAVAWAPAYLLPGYLTGAVEYEKLPNNLFPVLSSFLISLAAIILLFRYLSLKLQKDTNWYDALEMKRADSPTFNRLWRVLTAVDKNREFPLASLVLLIFSLSIFCVWTWLAIDSSALLDLNTLIFELSKTLRNDYLDPVLVTLTMLGDERFLYVSFISFVAIMFIAGDKWAALHIALAGLSAAAITHGLKDWFAVQRPDLVFNPPSSFAYPSGHSSGAAVLYGLFASFIAQHISRPIRWQAYAILSMPIVLIALSRVLLGVHWFADIVGGIFLGLSICALTRISYSRFHQPLEEASTKKAFGKIEIAGGFVWLCSFFVYHSLYYEQKLTSLSF